jgi:predicted MPP superfamily phosphohydrolase
LLFGAYTLLLFGTFIFLYIYPNQPKHAHNYTIYFYFNALLFIDLVIKLFLSLFYIVHLTLRKRRNARAILFAGIVVSIGLGLIMMYGTLWGKRGLKVTSVELQFKNLPEKFDNYKIVQFSDLHLGSFLHSKALLNKTEKQIKLIQPDLILFTGDLVNNFWEETVGWEDIFNRINASGNSYSILGNHDYGDYTTWKNQMAKEENFDKIIEAHEELGFHLLRNEHVPLILGKDTIYLAGVENWGHPPFPQLANLNKALQYIPENAFTILMTHDPAHWESQVKGKRNIEFSLSGHTHGLQWGIKVGGIPFSLAYLIRKNWGGLYQWNNTYLYVNTGLGTVGIPWRIDMTPELTVFTLKRGKVD